MSNSRKYRLFAMQPDEAVRLSDGFRFRRITPDYAIVYTNLRKPVKSVEITGADMLKMTMSDSIWLAQCNAQIVQEESKKNREKVTEATMKKLKDFERELEGVKHSEHDG